MTISLLDWFGEDDEPSKDIDDVPSSIDLTRDVERGWPIHPVDADALTKAFTALGFHEQLQPDELRPPQASLVSAIARFQAANGLAPSGSMRRGGMTILHLNKALARRRREPPRSLRGALVPTSASTQVPRASFGPQADLGVSRTPYVRDTAARITPLSPSRAVRVAPAAPPLLAEAVGERIELPREYVALSASISAPPESLERTSGPPRSLAGSSDVDHLRDADRDDALLAALHHLLQRNRDQHAVGVAAVVADLLARGIEVSGIEVNVYIEGHSSPRRYDIVIRDRGEYIGIEVKTTRRGLIDLDPEQVFKDADLMTAGRGTAPSLGVQITGIIYVAICAGCTQIDVRRAILEELLRMRGIPFRRRTLP